jgi:hypothetical protein
MDANKNAEVERLIFVTARLIDVMNRELEFLKSMQPQEIRELQVEKEDLARTYERCISEIKANPELLDQCDPTLKSRLEEVTATFNATLVENERSLRAVMSVSERLLNVIVDAIAEKQSGAAYSSTGIYGNGAKGPSQPLPFAVNQSL